MEEARPGDIVLLAGKGHENYQVWRDRTIEFDDREMAREILRRKGFSKKRRRSASSSCIFIKFEHSDGVCV